ncbi:amidohydrolase family protein [Sinomicrobium soli]|uniref:amidohydrolase family protein n=1 Tax=Sinomicrobium sp. N-1-3-6 TaxID=2219864 RepID=UPI000DCD624F|nr:amidohydrolase family protein [Sinomicrobium sp. N-1-3-6]RAV27750.1 amidohydrolase [Sinomicrobium sp. N-1-3-6]
MKKRLPLFLMAVLCSITIYAQEYFPKNDGVRTTDNSYTAFTNATIYVTPDRVIEGGTLLIHRGKVVAAGKKVSVPDNSLITDLDGKYIYPSFIDIYSDFGVQKPSRPASRGRTPQYDASRKGYYWNDHVMPEKEAGDHFTFDNARARELIKYGFGVVNTHVPDGIIRGTGMLVALDSADAYDQRILQQNTAQHLSFSKSVASAQNYPTSLMGAMALIRQLYRDAEWYAGGHADNRDLSLEALVRNRTLPQIFETGSYQNDLRAAKIAKEFGLEYILKGGVDEYQRIDEIKATGARFILPLNFPDAYDVTDPMLAQRVALADMRLWNQAPGNPAALAAHGIPFALTLNGLKNTSGFKTNLKRAIDYGLDKTTALKALTTVPAQLLGQAGHIGQLDKGSYANFLITSGDIFDEKTTLYENWVLGQKHIITDMGTRDIRGQYRLSVAGEEYTLTLKGSIEEPSAELKSDTTALKSKITYKNGWINLFFTPEDKEGFTRLTGKVKDEKQLEGKAITAGGTESRWTAARQKPHTPGDKDKKDSFIPQRLPITYPNKAYGFTRLPETQSVLFKNATVWTSEDTGILEQTDVLVKNGRIARIGKDLPASGATVIDATGKHLTAGIIDEHSHIAAASVNESGHNSSAEVSMEDVIDADDINIYRNLSGGVTTIQVLHGSANPIGGRSAIIKLKWGLPADRLIYENAPEFIKFALGENVKQSNWGSAQTVRFPQSRMGVEQVYADYFQRAREYAEAKESGKPFRFDYEMETLAEILDGKRFITCHSYVQSEINMLMKVAERFGFTVNTFTHILEGYKLADKMKAHGVLGASTFSDWWGYKFEVNDAIPYNAAIMESQGLNVAINSDDAEMSRRLNQEAAKTVKYGGVPEEEAWKMITINPAKMLHLDHRTGSIKEGKDADLVLWSDHPLSVYAVAEKTYIEGVPYYDYSLMQKAQQDMVRERNTLINQMIEAKNKGMKTRAPEQKAEKHFHCDTEVYGL